MSIFGWNGISKETLIYEHLILNEKHYNEHLILNEKHYNEHHSLNKWWHLLHDNSYTFFEMEVQQGKLWTTPRSLEKRMLK